MPSTRRVLSRIHQNVAELSENFADCLDFFDDSEPFVGPSSYFHHRAFAARSSHATIYTLLHDELFFDWLYACLTAWGLHRMGPGNAKLLDIGDLKASFRQQADAIERLSPLTITTLKAERAIITAREIWSVLSSLRVSFAEAKIVANSKALHHVLPQLVPPIDRQYTFNFFYNRKNLSISEDEAFTEMYVEFIRLATANRQEITSRIGKGWHTSESKVVDNAIMGYILKRRRPAPA